MPSDLLTEHPFVSYTLITIVSLMLGSFFNVVIYRLPKMMEAQWRRDCLELSGEEPSEDDNFNLALPHSHCPKCQAPVKAWQNIPVVSYILLRGRCASCRAPIGLRYPVIEAATAILAVLAFAVFGLSLHGAAIAVFCWLLLIMTVIDIDHQLLPDSLTLPLLWLGLAFHSVTATIPLTDAVWGAMAGYLSLWSVYWLFKLLTGKEGMGYGDFKLLAALGAWMGWQVLPLIIILSSLVGAVLGGLTLALSGQGRSTPMPFGPYLAGAGLIAMFWGDTLLNAYLQFAGLK
ncbi:prepilin peptidase [Spongiibacter nanhainus]|uniref:Prepilin leader peptidase/N-methyltransferase n=1 Tax=Spongiibacter nanhainus TaxID=2794344 RepID=A0A7T4UQT7_9GAMM|nr:A24 family peptidase [Spongiibacter nanhainus]QQD19083.1 prepilin peptidase [Spongiibacter nanhainus]